MKKKIIDNKNLLEIEHLHQHAPLLIQLQVAKFCAEKRQYKLLLYVNAINNNHERTTHTIEDNVTNASATRGKLEANVAL